MINNFFKRRERKGREERSLKKEGGGKRGEGRGEGREEGREGGGEGRGEERRGKGGRKDKDFDFMVQTGPCVTRNPATCDPGHSCTQTFWACPFPVSRSPEVERKKLVTPGSLLSPARTWTTAFIFLPSGTQGLGWKEPGRWRDSQPGGG